MTKIRVVWTVSYEGVADESVANTVDLEFEKMGLYMLMLEGQVRLENVNKESLMLRVDSGCDYDVCTENGRYMRSLQFNGEPITGPIEKPFGLGDELVIQDSIVGMDEERFPGTYTTQKIVRLVQE